MKNQTPAGTTQTGANIDVSRKKALQSGNAAFHKFAQRIYLCINARLQRF